MNRDQALVRILEITKELEVRKELYAELDNIILQLQKSGFHAADINGMHLELVDNFAEGKNTVFRPAGVKRFEVSVKPIKKAK